MPPKEKIEPVEPELDDDSAELDELRAENDELRAKVEALEAAAMARPVDGARFTAVRGPSEQAMREQAVMNRSEGARLDRIEQDRRAAQAPRPAGEGVRIEDTPVSAMAEGDDE